MPAVRAVAFDFNGTLSDDEPLLCAIYRELFAEHGRPLTEAEYYGRLAGSSEEAIIGGWLDVDGEELEALVAERIDRYRARASDGLTIGARVRSAVRYASERVPVAVVSGAFRAEIEPALEAAGIADAFTTLVTADDVANGKPHPESYELLVSRLDGIEPAAVVVFEDTEAGVAAATSAGCRCVAVRGTVAPERLARAEELVDAIDLAVLQRLLG
jgi:beta-phosphoglucomutase-like phosphatase (HAD superfamily)